MQDEENLKLQQDVNATFTLPFDLNKLMHLNFDVLKETIEFLARQQAEMNQRLGALETNQNTGP